MSRYSLSQDLTWPGKRLFASDDFARPAGELDDQRTPRPETTATTANATSGQDAQVVAGGGASPRGARILRLLDLQQHRDLLIPLCAALFVTACLIHDWRRHRLVHPAYVIGGLVIIASWPLRNMIGRSDWYFPIGEQVARLAHSIFGS